MTWRDQEVVRFRSGGAALEGKYHGPAPRASEPVFVLLHEGLGCIALWREFPEKLVRVTEVSAFSYSRQGYGHSDPVPLPRPIDYMGEEAVNVLPGVLDHLGHDNVILLGHSDGASIAAIHAGRVQDSRIKAVILMAPHFFAEPESVTAIAKVKTAFETTALREKLSRYHLDVEGAFYGWNQTWLNPAFLKWNIEDALPGIQVPVLVIQGLDDEYGTLKQIEVLEKSLGHSPDKLILEGCGHAPHLEREDQVLKKVLSFLNDNIRKVT